MTMTQTIRTGRLKLLLAVSIFFRVLCVAVYPPTNNLYSDPLRHWMNGERFLNPDIMGSIDPLLYQAWVWLVRGVSGGDAAIVSLFTMLLSGLLPWLAYRMLKEIMPRDTALIGGAVLGFMPSLTMIYAYFANETLLLPLMAAGIWLTFRAQRKRDLSSFALAALLWALACYTRIIAVPIAGMALGFACLPWLFQWKPLALRGAVTLALFGVFLVPACWHSSARLNFCAPMGMGYLTKIQRESMKKVIEINLPGLGKWGFASPATVNQPLLPFSTWMTRRTGTVAVQVDVKNARQDWEAELARVRAEQPKDLTWGEDFLENLTFVFFDPSWPDNNRTFKLGELAYLSRWLVLPMVLALLLLGARHARHLSRREALLPAMALAMTLLLIFQQQTPMEGRYRKPVELLLVASLAVLARKEWCKSRFLLSPSSKQSVETSVV